MTLSFSTQINRRPTFFVEQIINCLKAEGHHIDVLGVDVKMGMQLKDRFGVECGSKKHTIRADTKNRWRVGMPIHFVVKNRTPNRFQFAPILPVKAIQKIKIQWQAIPFADCAFSGIHPLRKSPVVFVDEQLFYRPYYTIGVDYTIDFGKPTVVKSSPLIDFGIEDLAKNDGFDSVEDFFRYFNSNFEGKIIHWTDYIYSF